VAQRDRLERRQCFSGGKIEACGLELLFDGAVDEESERGDVDVSFHATVGAMIDRPHVEDVLEVRKGAFDLRQFFVQPYGVDRGQRGLLGLDDVLSLVSLLAREVEGMLEEAEDAVLISPVVIAMTVIARKNPPRGRADLLRRLAAALAAP